VSKADIDAVLFDQEDPTLWQMEAETALADFMS
jgi:hypothetical protein